LLQELDSIEGSTPKANNARNAIGGALSAIAKNINPNELPQMLKPLLNALSEIKGSANEANWARFAIGKVLNEIARNINPNKLPQMLKPLLNTLSEIKGSTVERYSAEYAIAWALARALLRIQGFKLNSKKVKFLAWPLGHFLSLSEDGLSLFPKYGDLESLQNILDPKASTDHMISHLENYKAQIIARHERAKQESEGAQDQKKAEPGTPKDIWLTDSTTVKLKTARGELRSEDHFESEDDLESKDYFEMSYEQLIEELGGIQESTPERHVEIHVIGLALDEKAKRTNSRKLPKTLQTVLKIFSEIEGSTDSGHLAREDLGRELGRIAKVIDPDMLPQMLKPLLNTLLLKVKGSGIAENETRATIGIALNEVAQKIQPEKLPEMLKSLLNTLSPVKGSAFEANQAREAIGLAISSTLLRIRGFKLRSKKGKSLQEPLKNVFSLLEYGLSLFPIYGDIESLRTILDPAQELDLILDRLVLYEAQIIARYERTKQESERAQDQKKAEPRTPEDIWLTDSTTVKPDTARGELRSKDYSKMGYKQLLQELDSIKGSTPEANNARYVIGQALSEIAKRIKPNKLPQMLEPLLNTLSEIEGSTDEASWARSAIGWALREVAKRIKQNELPQMLEPRKL